MQDELKVLSISVAAYNSEDYLRRCLDSLVNTSILDELDIIIVNDGSKDATLDIAREYENRFRSSAKNSIILQADGGISILDDSLCTDWRIQTDKAILSEKDTKHSLLKDFDSPFIIKVDFD